MTARDYGNHSLGRYGEACAARFLVRDKGMTLLDRNWRCEVGEIDLVLRDGAVLVVCEVKTRRSHRFGDPLEAVGVEKSQRLRLLAARWCEEHALRPAEMRVDLVGVLVESAGVTNIDHLVAVGG